MPVEFNRYLTFVADKDDAHSQALDSYKILGSDILPFNFGPIAQVNVLLGENNSGKSRFMRAVMRDNQMHSIQLWSNYQDFNQILKTIKLALDNADSMLGFTIYINPNSYTLGGGHNQQELINLFWNTMASYNQRASVEITPRQNLAPIIETYDKISELIISEKQLISAFTTKKSANNSIEILTLIDELEKANWPILRLIKIFKECLISGSLGTQLRNGGNTTNIGAVSFLNAGWSTEQNKRDDYLLSCITALEKIVQTITTIKDRIEQQLKTAIVPKIRTYIPTLRSARTFIDKDGKRLSIDNDIFLHTTEYDYSLKNSEVEINTGFSLYDAVDSMRSAGIESRKAFKKFEDFLSNTFFNGSEVEVVAEKVKGERGGNILVAVNGIERNIHDLGDGIQAIIMLLYPLFIAQKNAWFFIEEPETYLHPGFQRLFIETIVFNQILRAKNLIIFLTTHSNHILDFAIEDSRHVNIFTFRRQSQNNHSIYQIQLTQPKDIENLNALGVQNSSVFLANCSIWVEGITDRLYFRAYLTAYLNHLKNQPDNKQPVSLLEGLHYTFLEYSGGNISHYNFSELEGPFTPQLLEDIKALSIANRIMLVADQDAGKNTRHQARENQQHTGFTYHVLNCREVENLLSPKLIVKGLTKLFSQYTFNADQFKQTEYRQKYLGSYIRQQYPSIKLPTSFTAESGTIGSSYKRKFAEAVVIPPLAWDDLSSAAQDFTKQLYSFIIAHNLRLGSN